MVAKRPFVICKFWETSLYLLWINLGRNILTLRKTWGWRLGWGVFFHCASIKRKLIFFHCVNVEHDFSIFEIVFHILVFCKWKKKIYKIKKVWLLFWHSHFMINLFFLLSSQACGEIFSLPEKLTQYEITNFFKCNGKKQKKYNFLAIPFNRGPNPILCLTQTTV